MLITLIGSLVIIIKKLISRQIIQRIPKSNILAQPKNNQEQSIEMATLHSTPRIIKVGLTDKKTYKNVIQCSPFLLNNSKHNKNIINSYGLFIIGVTFCIFFSPYHIIQIRLDNSIKCVLPFIICIILLRSCYPIYSLFHEKPKTPHISPTRL